MSDPAVEAAQRACSYPINEQEMNHTGGCMVSAAREAFGTVRDLHKPTHQFRGLHFKDPLCAECDHWWPCNTAKLIYTSEELA